MDTLHSIMDRRSMLRQATLALLALSSAGPWNARRVLAQTGSGIKAYIATGHDVPSILTDPDYEKVFRSIFAGQRLTFELAPSRNTMLANIMAADIVYLNVHSNKNVIVAGDAQPIDIGMFIRAFRTAGRGPSLIVVSGCNTLRVETKTTFPRALCIEDPSAPRAYIGFNQVVLGGIADNYFRVFFAHWLKPRADNSYRTLEEARSDAIDFIERKREQSQDPNAGKMMRFAPLTPAIGRQLSIVGNAGLRLPDLDGRTNVPSCSRDDASPAPGPVPPASSPTNTTPPVSPEQPKAGDINKLFKQ